MKYQKGRWTDLTVYKVVQQVSAFDEKLNKASIETLECDSVPKATMKRFDKYDLYTDYFSDEAMANSRLKGFYGSTKDFFTASKA